MTIKTRSQRKKETAEYCDKIQLPQWLQDALPVEEEKPVILLYWDEKGFHHSQSPEDTYETIKELHDIVRTEYQRDYLLRLDESLEGHGGRLDFMGFHYPTGKEGRTTWIGESTSNKDKINSLKLCYDNFLREVNPYYQAHQDNWAVAYQWLSCHPVFWTKFRDDTPYNWKTDCGLSHLWVSVNYSESEDETYVQMEHGSHVEPDYRTHYHDPRLDVYAHSYEEGIVSLAQKVNQFFNVDGSEKDDVDYEKSPVEVSLEEASRGVKDADKS